MVTATKEAVEHNDSSTWQKRGFKSKNGVATLTSIDTGKVIAIETLTKYVVVVQKQRLNYKNRNMNQNVLRTTKVPMEVWKSRLQSNSFGVQK